jgi:ssDNA-binding Zn-finger/Zn-ribbon topoisomerase 1
MFIEKAGECPSCSGNLSIELPHIRDFYVCENLECRTHFSLYELREANAMIDTGKFQAISHQQWQKDMGCIADAKDNTCSKHLRLKRLSPQH